MVFSLSILLFHSPVLAQGTQMLGVGSQVPSGTTGTGAGTTGTGSGTTGTGSGSSGGVAAAGTGSGTPQQLGQIDSLEEILGLLALANTMDTARPIVDRGLRLCRTTSDFIHLAQACYAGMVPERLRASWRELVDHVLQQGAAQAISVAEFTQLASACLSSSTKEAILIRGVNAARSASDVIALMNECTQVATADTIARSGIDRCRSTTDYIRLARSVYAGITPPSSVKPDLCRLTDWVLRQGVARAMNVAAIGQLAAETWYFETRHQILYDGVRFARNAEDIQSLQRHTTSDDVKRELLQRFLANRS